MLQALMAFGALVLMSVATAAHAQTAININGSSAGRLFASKVPVDVCDIGTGVSGQVDSNWPQHYATANNNQHAWVCNRGGNPVIIRYFATASADGYNRLLQPTADPASQAAFMVVPPTGCAPAVHQVGTGGREYDELLNCSNTTATANLPVHMGAADVQGGSFGQVGPLIPLTQQPVIDASTLNSQAIVVVPFTIAVGSNVVRINAAGTNGNGLVQGLTRLQVESILAKQVTDWRQLGLGTTTSPPNGALEATSPIVLCPRTAGSGTKASIDQEVMINASEATLSSATTVFNASTSNVQTCLTSNPRGIGYLDADSVAGPYYAVALDGYKANDTSLTDPKSNVKCGRYAYWSAWRLNRRTTSEGALIDDVNQAFINAAQLASNVNAIPNTGNFWVALSEMNVTKNLDKGPLSFTAGAHPSCLY